jgi:hypothetical protein
MLYVWHISIEYTQCMTSGIYSKYMVKYTTCIMCSIFTEYTLRILVVWFAMPRQTSRGATMFEFALLSFYILDIPTFKPKTILLYIMLFCGIYMYHI